MRPADWKEDPPPIRASDLDFQDIDLKPKSPRPSTASVVFNQLGAALGFALPIVAVKFTQGLSQSTDPFTRQVGVGITIASFIIGVPILCVNVAYWIDKRLKSGRAAPAQQVETPRPRQPWSRTTIAWVVAGLLAACGAALCVRATFEPVYVAQFQRMLIGTILIGIGAAVFVAGLFVKK